MSCRLYEAPGVDHDLADHYHTIEQGGQPDAALRMLRAYDDLTQRLCNWPLSGRAFETDANGGLELTAQVWCDFRRGVVAPGVFWGNFSSYESGEPHVRIVEDVAAIFPAHLDRDCNRLTFTLRRRA